MNNVKDSIGWADYTWNPIVGCHRGCKWGKGGCYAKRFYTRFQHSLYNGVPFEKMQFFQERLYDKQLGKGSIIFVGSMSDIEYWNRNWTEIIINTIKHYPDDTFMFLSKNSSSYFGFDWPSNTMQGLTITGENPDNDLVNITLQAGNISPFLSIEPLLSEIPKITYTKFEKVIVGAMTGPGAIIPKKEWIDSIKDNIPADNIYWKNNIKKYI